MNGRGQGEDSPGDSGPRAAVPARAVVRGSEPGTAGDSGVMGAADTAVAMAASGEHTEPVPATTHPAP